MKKTFAIIGLAVVLGFSALFYAASVRAQQGEIDVFGTATNKFIGNTDCYAVWGTEGAIKGTCENEYFGVFSFDDQTASVVEDEGEFFVRGYGFLDEPFDGEEELSKFYFSSNDPVTIVDNIFYGEIDNKVMGTLVFSGTFSSPDCGNNTLDGNEQCDDGNTDNGDGCSSLCLIEITPINLELLSVYPPSGARDVSLSQPLLFVFSDDVDIESFEQNVDFNILDNVDYTWLSDQVVRVDHDDFDPNTLYAFTVDGRVRGLEAMSLTDDVVFSFRTVASGITVPVVDCGDGYYDVSDNEQCDDGNVRNGDGCSASCLIENGWSCSGVISLCTQTTPSCGDGHLDGEISDLGYSDYYYDDSASISAEQCDDGNNEDGDGCDASCRVEKGFRCFGNHPSMCLVYSSSENVLTPPPVTLPTLFTWFDPETGVREPAESYSFTLDGYEVVSADWIEYDEETGEFYVTELPAGILAGEYLFTVRDVSTGNIVNATIRISDVERFLDTEGEFQLVQWLTAILASEEGADVAELGVETKTGQVANLIALSYLYQQLTSN